MEYLSTTNLAEELQMEPGALFNELKTSGWIQRNNDKWVLTQLGISKGGKIRNTTNYGEYIVWPKNVEIKSVTRENEKGKFLNATLIGKHYNISSQRLNLILSELGWIEKNLKGWVITKQGKIIGGKQYEHETSGNMYVLWPETIFANRSLKEVFNETQIQKETSINLVKLETPNLPQIKDDYRLNYEAKHRTLDGHYVRSRAEVIIDNILYQYGIVHAYERKLIIGDEEVLSDFYLPAKMKFH